MKKGNFPTYLICAVALSVLPLAYAEPASVTSSVQRSSFGQPCNRTSRCDSRGWLGCYNGICDCIKQDEMIFQESIKKCVSKSGERCTFAVDDLEDNNFIFEVTTCVANATCSMEWICTCGSKFFENENGTCSPAFEHQESCDSSSQCSQYQALQCDDGLCQCEKSTSIYSDIENEGPQCVGLAEQQCINSLCVLGATCSGNECTCDVPFYADEDDLCVPKIQILGNCTATNQCEQKPGQKLVCLNGKCKCDPNISIYGTSQESIKYSQHYGYGSYSNNADFHGFTGESLTQCVGIVGSPCLDMRCTSNGFCSYPTKQYYSNQEGVCKCRGSFTPSKRGTCATGYQSSCSTSSTCIDDLVCRNSGCLCQYVTQYFDASKKSCTSQVGGPCADNSSCNENAECTLLDGVGHCACKSGYAEVLNGNCEAAYDTRCSSSDPCDSLASLQCIDQKCKCPTFAKYSSKLRKCVGLSGAKCDVSKKSRAECTKHAKCEEGTHPLLSGTCTCSPGFIETSNYTCKASAKEGVIAVEIDED